MPKMKVDYEKLKESRSKEVQVVAPTDQDIALLSDLLTDDYGITVKAIGDEVCYENEQGELYFHKVRSASGTMDGKHQSMARDAVYHLSDYPPLDKGKRLVYNVSRV